MCACSTRSENPIMLALTLGAITASGLLIYLLAALFAPEKF
ncbi:K(+)-transporting ATPase subunit F [Sphingobium boeckii]